jgi:hypothetical protein
MEALRARFNDAAIVSSENKADGISAHSIPIADKAVARKNGGSRRSVSEFIRDRDISWVLIWLGSFEVRANE